MSRVFLDTNIFIYLIEDEGELGRKSMELIERLTARRDLVYTSTLTLGEVLTQPLSKGDTRLADLYEEKLGSPGVHLLDFDRISARNYARIRLDRQSSLPPHGIKIPNQFGISFPGFGRSDFFHAMAMPEPAGAAKSRQAAFRADAGASEHEEPVVAVNPNSRCPFSWCFLFHQPRSRIRESTRLFLSSKWASMLAMHVGFTPRVLIVMM